MLDLLLTAWGYVAFMMFLLWLVQVKTLNASFVDLGWTIGLVICAWVYNYYTDVPNPHKVLILILVTLWAARLASHLILRLLKDPSEDKRYAKIRSDWKTHQHMKFFLMFQFQGLLDVTLSWGFLLICLNSSTHYSILEYVAIAVWLIGFIGESISDYQLKTFKSDPQNRGKTCQVGLWHYSRHPNYFFEWLIWVAYFLMALGATSYGWTAIILPILMYYFLIYVSGVPLAEAQSLKNRGEEYRRYQETTSMFIPLPKRKI